MNDYDSYLSPFSWRYGSAEMRQIWSESYKRKLWRQIWLQLAEVQARFGLVSKDQVEDLRRHLDQVDVERSLEIEAQINHDLMAELKAFAEQAPTGGAILHLGATSTDIEDNADALRIRRALSLIVDKLAALLQEFAAQIETWANTPILAFTHLQPAEPSTLGYRFAGYAQDLLDNYRILRQLSVDVRGKGFKGAVGTAASYVELLNAVQPLADLEPVTGPDKFEQFEQLMSAQLGLPFYPVTNQTYPRLQDYRVISALAALGASLYKFAFDLRLMQSPVMGELAESFGKRQVGSSAMPFKRNPIQSEKIDSLARLLAGQPQVAWQNAANSLLERTLDDSANRRSLLPESFLAADEILLVATRILAGLQINQDAIRRNLERYAPFAATERLLMRFAQAGADRQEMHERLREHALQAWQFVQRGERNPLVQQLSSDPVLQRYLTAEQIAAALQVEGYTGIAAERAREMAKKIRAEIAMQ